MKVVRPSGRLRNALATLLGMPEAGEVVPVHLQVVVEGKRERWTRCFGVQRVQRLETIQWARGELLMEASGPVSFSSALVLDGPSLHYAFQRAWLWFVPLPHWLGPSVIGSVWVEEKHWRVDVRILAPFLGELVRYGGWVEPE